MSPDDPIRPRGFTILAIDPGLAGALAWYAPAAPDLITVEDMPIMDGEVDAAALARRIRQLRPNVAVVERVGPMPQDGVRQAFGFGNAYGSARSVIAALEVSVRLVTPQTWKKHYRLGGGPDGKEAARARAIQIWPACDRFTRKKDAGRAEAALLARFAAEKAL